MTTPRKPVQIETLTCERCRQAFSRRKAGGFRRRFCDRCRVPRRRERRQVLHNAKRARIIEGQIRPIIEKVVREILDERFSGGGQKAGD